MADITLSGFSIGLVNPDPYYTTILTDRPTRLSSDIIGSIGFRYEGGIITVDATSPQVRLNFDRPMIYGGQYTNTLPGDPYSITQPSLTPDARAIDVPIVVPDPHITSVDADSAGITIHVDKSVVFDDVYTPVPGGLPYDIEPPYTTGETNMALRVPVTVPAQVMALVSTTIINSTTIQLVWENGASVISTSGWSITTTNGKDVTIQSITMSSPPTTVITTTEHTQGANYILHIPAYAVVSDTGKLNAAATPAYTGIGLRPTVYQVSFSSPTAIMITYSESMDIATTTNPANYSIAGLTINSVSMLSSTVFVLNTSTMTPNTTYTLTLSGVLDSALNPV